MRSRSRARAHLWYHQNKARCTALHSTMRCDRRVGGEALLSPECAHCVCVCVDRVRACDDVIWVQKRSEIAPSIPFHADNSYLSLHVIKTKMRVKKESRIRKKERKTSSSFTTSMKTTPSAPAGNNWTEKWTSDECLHRAALERVGVVVPKELNCAILLTREERIEEREYAVKRRCGSATSISYSFSLFMAYSCSLLTLAVNSWQLLLPSFHRWVGNAADALHSIRLVSQTTLSRRLFLSLCHRILFIPYVCPFFPFFFILSNL